MKTRISQEKLDHNYECLECENEEFDIIKTVNKIHGLFRKPHYEVIYEYWCPVCSCSNKVAYDIDDYRDIDDEECIEEMLENR